MKRLVVFIWLLDITVRLILNWAAACSVSKDQLDITITDVSDGDSLNADKFKLCLHGIDAPECEQTCTNAEGENYACGKRATDWLGQLLKTEKRLSCNLLDIDKYRRLIVRCFKSLKNINQAIKEAGWAVAYTCYSDDYVNSETEAKSKHHGLWQKSFIHPESGGI